MPKYRVTVHFSIRTKDAPDSCSFEIQGGTGSDARRIGLIRAKFAHPRCRAGLVEVDLLPEEPNPESPMHQEQLTDDQRSQLEAIVNSFPERHTIRLACKLALEHDRITLEPVPTEHDFGTFGDLSHCRRPDCKASNTPPANRWGCKGAA